MAATALALIEPPQPNAEVTPRPTGMALCQSSKEKVREYLDNSRSRNTIRDYESDWRQFTAWCLRANLVSLPATQQTIALYLAYRAGQLKSSRLTHHLVAIAKAHRRAELPNPCKDSELLLETWKGIRNSHGAKVNQKAALCTDDLRFMLRHAPDCIIGIRDQALLLIGFAGAFRRRELVALDVEDLTFSAAGVVITIRKSKTDQAGEGQEVALTTCKIPLRAQ